MDILLPEPPPHRILWFVHWGVTPKVLDRKQNKTATEVAALSTRKSCSGFAAHEAQTGKPKTEQCKGGRLRHC